MNKIDCVIQILLICGVDLPFAETVHLPQPLYEALTVQPQAVFTSEQHRTGLFELSENIV